MVASSSSSSCQSYDVFLSFRGKDTRNSFTAHLCCALARKGINTFIDATKLKKGQVIVPAIAAAIENSKICIIVLSKNYASSSWCLEELVKVTECKRTMGLMVVPIFYNVDPSDVRYQRGKFGEALAKREKKMKENMERVQIWRDALTEVANLSGWDSRNKKEPKLIKEIVKDILKKLSSTSTSDNENMVGKDSRVLLCSKSGDEMPFHMGSCTIRNQEVNGNSITMIQFVSPHPPHNSTILLEEIHEGDSSGSGWSNGGSESENSDSDPSSEGGTSGSGWTNDGSESESSDSDSSSEGGTSGSGWTNDGSESENCDDDTSDEEGPFGRGCSDDDSESEMRPEKRLKCTPIIRTMRIEEVNDYNLTADGEEATKSGFPNDDLPISNC